MTRGRFLIGGIAAAVAAVGMFFGGVFSTGSVEPPATSPVPPPTVIAGRDANEALKTLLEGFSTGDTSAFVRDLEAELQKNETDVNTLTVLGLAYQQLQRETGDPSFLGLSEKALRKAVELRPDQPLATTGLATLAVARHRWNDAVELARVALAQNPDDATALGALGDALLSLGRYDAAFEAFDEMAVLSPSVASFSRVAYGRELLGRPNDAVEALAFVFELRLTVPEHEAWTRVQLGHLFFNTGQLVKAEKAYERALERLPGYVYAEAGLARVEAARGGYEAAVGRLETVVELLPTPQNAILLGDVLTAAGRDEEAKEAYALVEAIDRLLAANGVRIELQTALFDLDHDRDVSAALERAFAAREQAPGINADDAVAWGLYKNGRCQEALRFSESALRLGTKDALMLFHRGMIERCLGDDAAARGFLEQALEINPHFSFIHAPTAKELVA
jgi:tetratricopeptide (TPR) repeat protein